MGRTSPLSKDNRKLVEIRKAIRRGTLTAEGLLPIEGPRLIAEAVRSGLSVVEVFVENGASVDPVSGATLYQMESSVFKTIQTTETSHGIVALVRPPQFQLERMIRLEDALLLVLAGLQDPGNVGTILRIGESFGATGCIALKGTASLFNGKTVRASAGSLFRLPHVWTQESERVFSMLRSRGIRVVGTSSKALKTIDDWDWRQPVAVVLGNEGRGLSSEEQAFCDTVLRIPQDPEVESLNAAIAAAVILYEAWKQRK